MMLQRIRISCEWLKLKHYEIYICDLLCLNILDSRFCRKGKVGGYRDEMDEKNIKLFDEFTARKKKLLQLEC